MVFTPIEGVSSPKLSVPKGFLLPENTTSLLCVQADDSFYCPEANLSLSKQQFENIVQLMSQQLERCEFHSLNLKGKVKHQVLVCGYFPGGVEALLKNLKLLCLWARYL